VLVQDTTVLSASRRARRTATSKPVSRYRSAVSAVNTLSSRSADAVLASALTTSGTVHCAVVAASPPLTWLSSTDANASRGVPPLTGRDGGSAPASSMNLDAHFDLRKAAAASSGTPNGKMERQWAGDSVAAEP
jgi:hypothetical protein